MTILDKTEAFVEAVLLQTAFFGDLWSYIEFTSRRYALLEIVRTLGPYMEGPVVPDIDFMMLIKFGFILAFAAKYLRAALFENPKGVGLVPFVLVFGAGHIVIQFSEIGVILLIASVVLAMIIVDDDGYQRKPPQPRFNHNMVVYRVTGNAEVLADLLSS